MGKMVSDYVLDGSHEKTAEANILHVCTAEPADYAGIAAVSLGSVALTPGLGNGDFSVANGDVSGRKVTLAAQDNGGAGIAIGTAGDIDHIVLADTANSRLLRVTTCALRTVTTADTVNVTAHDYEIEDPT